MNHREGNLLAEVKQGIIIQQVNAQGIMAAGFADQIRHLWPGVYGKYVEVMGPPYTQRNKGAEMLGKVIPTKVGDNLWVVSVVGQQFFGRDGKKYTSYDALDTALREVRKLMDQAGWTSEDVHHPLIGCGLGGGDWQIVAAIISANIGPDTTLWTAPKQS